MSQIDLNQKFPDLRPIKSPPALFRINGCGVGMYGRRDADYETGTYVATWCLSLVFIPVLALRAYRVAGAPDGGWYFVGRERLSGLAKGWNLVLLAGILATVAGVQYAAYTSTPAYQAKREMARAQKMVENGQLSSAAKVYQRLAVAGMDQSDAAAGALGGLLDNQCRQAPLKESAGVYAAAGQVARRRHAPSPADVADKGLKLAAERGDSDLAGGVAVLDAVRPLVRDTRAVDARRLALLGKWAAAEPSNLAVVTPLASLLAEQGRPDEAKKLLLPVRDKLGDGEGARVLGTILGREGDYEGAHALLWPYVKSRLDALHAAEKSWEDTMNRLQEREIQLLRDGKGPRELFQRYESAGEDEKRAIVREHVNARIKGDAEYVAAQEALEREAGVVPVTLELGIVMLQRAQGQTDPAARKSQLEAAEQVFLAVRGVAGETDEYRLSLGQVYYWLGKQAEGRKLFEEFLAAKGRGAEDLLRIASTLRQLGAEPEARAMAEEAYNKASTDEHRHAAATVRYLCATDNDDGIAWLKKGDAADPHVKAALAKALGHKAFEEGRDDEAARQYRAAVEAYAAMPRTAGTVNEAALAHYAIFQVTGDEKALERCYDYFQQAVALDPSNSILLYNAGVTMLSGALADVVGGEIDLRALRATGDVSLLYHLYRDQAGRDALVARVKAHPGVARAVSYLEKVTVLAPKNVNSFAHLYGVHRFTHNEAALRALEQRARSAGFDTSDHLQNTLDHISGAKDQQNIPKVTAGLKRSEAATAKLRGKGGRTAAVALGNEVESILALDAFTGSADTDKAVALAEEAHRLAPSMGTASTVRAARLSRAARSLRRSDPAFDAFYKKYGRAAGASHLLAAAASEGWPFQQIVLRDPDVQRAIAVVREESRHFPESGSAYDWALLRGAHPAEAEKIAAVVRKTPRKWVDQSLATNLHPASAAEALETYWTLQILGKPAEAGEALSAVAGKGIPVPGRP